ncbi:LmbE-like protein [Heliocybe sulcata]|uniref:N-acetylglucosaminylphosphatidylinositol deacetylase n=1 Tax=Heliocybe sulcata TaxID=5364 RepID=A0A5C3MUR9_9AGAM|nr:LmbE-like protein [Heliocybe sulcata]
MSRYLTLLLLPILAILLAAHVEVNTYHFLSSSHAGRAQVLLLTAHPDDECMFFGPTLTALKKKSDIDVHSLCLSIGDQDGLGDVRRRELGRSLDVLGVDSRRSQVLDQEDLKDNITVTWDSQTIADVVSSYVSEQNISTILTFDEHGISSHPNHVSLFHGTALTLSLHPNKNLRAYALVTTPVMQKYTGVLGGFVSKIRGTLSPVSELSEDEEVRVVVASSMAEYSTALRAMLQHWSQLVWFRWLYVAFSRYMWVNDWVEIKHACVGCMAGQAKA